MEQAQAPGGLEAIIGLVWLAVVILSVVSLWKIFTKAGQPGWGAIVPFYNFILILKIAGKPWWWIFLMFIPFVNMIIAVIAMIALANAFGKGTGYGLGLAFLGFIFLPMLAFGEAQYVGSGGEAPPPQPAA